VAPLGIDYEARDVRPPPKKNRKLVLASVIVFVVSLALPGYYVGGGSSSWSPGFACLLCGCLGAPAWLANPCLFATWFGLRRESALRITPVVSAVAALAFAIAFLFQHQVPRDEAGNMDTITARGLGYWLWLTSIVVALVASVVGLGDE
jgi:hypothetical protein